MDRSCLGLLVLGLSLASLPALAELTPAETRVADSAPLVLTVTPLGFWCGQDGSVVVTLTNVSRRTLRFAIDEPAWGGAAWPANAGNAYGTEVILTSISSCVSTDGARCVSQTMQVELLPGSSTAWTLELSDIPTDRSELRVRVRLEVAPILNLPTQEEEFAIEGSTQPFELVRASKDCWQTRMRRARP